MFDELARRGNGYANHVVLPSCSIPVALQKRLSLVPQAHRESIFGTPRSEETSRREQEDKMEERTKTAPPRESSNHVEITVCCEAKPDNDNEDTAASCNDANNPSSLLINDGDKSLYHRESSGLTPLRYSRRHRNGARPLSGSSIASSTSSSGCSNQGNACTNNPYLASVESLADTCASSQGSGDSGVVTVSEASSRIGDGDDNQRRNSGAEDSPLHHKLRYCDPHRNPVERVLLEIVDTEAIYVEHLRQVIQGYLIFWRNDPASLVQHLQLNDLFSNIEDIFEFNRQFLMELENCGLDPVCVANNFIKHNAGFKVYTEYCTNYPRTVSVLTDLMSQEELATAFRERQAALGHALPLGSFLLKPVQRILKYHLLLENLSKEYGAGYHGKENKAEGQSAIEGALAAMTGIAQHINAMKRKHEHAVRVQEIQSLLYGWPGPDLTTSGELVAEGRFRMRGAKAPRHAFLFDKMLLLTKKKEDGLLVYKAHIMCSNLMLIESLPGEPCSFHVIPFDNPRLQYTLQARNLEQKREWTLQIKRVILENYNAVIPSHARQLVLQLGQTQTDDDTVVDKGSAKKQYTSPPEYLEKRKQERERRRSETGLRQKLKKTGRKSDVSANTAENSPASPRKNQFNESISHYGSRDQSLNRGSEIRTSKVKDRFTNWRRKSEPGFQSYVSLNQSDDDQKEENPEPEIEFTSVDGENVIPQTEEDDSILRVISSDVASFPVETKETNSEPESQAQTVEEIVGHILMQNQEFQKLLEKQRTNSILNTRQRFNKHTSADTSDDSDNENSNYAPDNRSGRRRQRLLRTNNAWNALASPVQRESLERTTLHLKYDNIHAKHEKSVDNAKNKLNRVQEKKAMFEAFKKQNIVTDSKIIKTALRIRENSILRNDERNKKDAENEILFKKQDKVNIVNTEESGNFGNYDNLQHVWEGLGEERDEIGGNDSPTQPAVWLTKVCGSLPTAPQKCGSLPRSFQISPVSNLHVTKSRFLQRDGKPMSDRPFTIASDKPAEINLEDMERYASTCQTGGRIAKFPTSTSTNSSTSTFFCPLDESLLTDSYSELPISTMSTNIHPDHKIYRANGSISGTAIFKSVLSKAGSRLQGLRSTLSTETLECSEELERSKYSRSLNSGKSKRKSKMKPSRESSSDVEEVIGCVTAAPVSSSRTPSAYYKQGSSGLGARIAQSDYADPTFLFANEKKNVLVAENEEKSEADSFYEKSFETIENYVDYEADEAFRDSAIFSDADELPSSRIFVSQERTKKIRPKVAPPVPAKKPEYLRIKARVITSESSLVRKEERNDFDDVSAGQSQAGWVKKMVGQLQGHVEKS